MVPVLGVDAKRACAACGESGPALAARRPERSLPAALPPKALALGSAALTLANAAAMAGPPPKKVLQTKKPPPIATPMTTTETAAAAPEERPADAVGAAGAGELVYDGGFGKTVFVADWLCTTSEHVGPVKPALQMHWPVPTGMPSPSQ